MSIVHSLVRRSILTVSGLLLLGVAAGCSEPGEDASDSDDLQSRIGATPTATLLEAPQFFDGYNTLLDDSSPSCVTPAGGNGPAFTVGNITDDSKGSYVESREDLAKQLGLDLGLTLDYGVAHGNGALNLLRSFKKSNSSVNILIKVAQSYSVTSTRNAALTPDALAALKDPNAFMAKCGDSFIRGVRYQAALTVLIHFEAANEDQAKQISADLGGKGASVAIPIDASMKAKLEKTASTKGVVATASLTSTGFIAPDASVGAVTSSGITPEMFAKIESLRTQLGKSLMNDACMDATNGQCDGTPAVGYDKNTRRNAQAVAVSVTSYSKASNAPVNVGGKDPYGQMRDTLVKVEKYVRGYKTLENRMEGAYYSEIEPVLQESPEGRAEYNLAPPAAPVESSDDIQRIAQSWQQKFQPTQVGDGGTVANKLRSVIEDCTSNAKHGNYAGCHMGADPATLADYKAISKEIDNYIATGRIIPMRYADAGLVRASNAKGACATKGLRLPKSGEVVRLSPPLRLLQDNRAWFDDDKNQCSGKDALYDASKGIASGMTCNESTLNPSSWLSVHAVCIPPAGVFGTIPAL